MKQIGKSIYLIEEIIRLIKDGDKLISLDNGNSIIVCGDTGSAKSTLNKLLSYWREIGCVKTS